METESKKREYLLRTIQLLSNEFKNNEDIQNSFKKIADTICHTAPEILNTRWTDIYNFCKCNLNDTTNMSHINSLHIYNSRLKEYKKFD